MKAFLNLKNFRHEAKFSTWLIRIALNETSSYFASKRYRERKRTESFDAALHDRDNSGAEVEEQNRRKLVMFRRALAELKPALREVLVMCALEGRSYEEAAQVLNIPIGTVRSRLNTARLSLKRIMDGM